jgi:ligand-binding SRPBCC domain-containing protein
MSSSSHSRRTSLQSRQWVPYPLEVVWRLFSNPANLAELTPPHYNASVKLVGDVFMENCKVIISMKPYGIPSPVKWISKIEGLRKGEARCEFVDLQLSGPFAYWRHHHVFESGDKEFHGKRSGQTVTVQDGGTWIIDDVEYQMPFGILGAIAEKIFARDQLESLFAFRKGRVLELLARESRETKSH